MRPEIIQSEDRIHIITDKPSIHLLVHPWTRFNMPTVFMTARYIIVELLAVGLILKTGLNIVAR